MTVTITAQVDQVGGEVSAAASAGAPIAMGTEASGSPSATDPKELMLVALAGCAGLDVAGILTKKRQRVTTYEIEVHGESAEDPPRVFTSIIVEHRVSGDVAPEPLRRSIELSATKYCPVNAMLSAVARVEHRYLLLDATGTKHAATVAIVGPNRVVQVIQGV
ncbi:MAG TPA: OsmC family protein [Candidatus Limnocylindria bacterium]